MQLGGVGRTQGRLVGNKIEWDSCTWAFVPCAGLEHPCSIPAETGAGQT